MGGVAVPKVRYKTISTRRDGSEVPVVKVALPKTGQKSPFATSGCLWNTYGQGLRSEGPIQDHFDTPGWL